MGNLIICTGEYAKTPYYLSAVCMNIYSVEELCYLFSVNPFIITNDIMDMNLVEWLENECGLAELANELKGLFRKGSQVGEFVNIILNYVNYCTPEEIASIEDTLRSNSGLNDFERKKKQGDYLLNNARFESAIDEYEALLAILPEVENSLKPVIFHNIGFAYANLFMFDVAAKYFKRAYENSHLSDSLIQYLASARMYMSEERYLKLISDNDDYHAASLKLESKMKQAMGDFEASRENRMLSALEIYKDEGNVSSYYEEIDKLILKLKEDYLNVVMD